MVGASNRGADTLWSRSDLKGASLETKGRIIRSIFRPLSKKNGAEAGSRTLKGLRPLGPEPSASANSATSARTAFYLAREAMSMA